MSEPEDFTIVERADGPGGVWRANTYPGAACDVESALYSFSFAQNAGWSRAFAQQRLTQAELLRFEPLGQLSLLHFADIQKLWASAAAPAPLPTHRAHL